MTFIRDYEHFSRHVTWGGSSGDADLTVIGKNWSGAAFVWAIASTEGAAADITLTNQTAGTQGVSATYDANYVHPISGAVVGATIIRPQIDEATFEGLTGWGTPAVKKVMFHDLLVTPIGESQRVFCRGSFTVHPGAGD